MDAATKDAKTKGGKTILGGQGAPTSRFALRKKPATLLSEDVAMDQVLDLLEYYDIDIERLPEGGANLETSLKQLTDYVRRGSVEIGRDADQKIKVTLNLSDGKTAIEFAEIGARHKLAMDKVKGQESYARIYALAGALSGLGAAAIEKLPARDLAIVEILGMVFLAA